MSLAERFLHPRVSKDKPVPSGLKHCLSLPDHSMSSRAWGPGAWGLCTNASVSPLVLGLGSSGCLRGFSEVLSQQGRRRAGPLRRHRPAKAPAQQQNTKAPQLWPTNLLPRALPSCHRTNLRLGPRVPTHRGVAQGGGVLSSSYPPQPVSLPNL